MVYPSTLLIGDNGAFLCIPMKIEVNFEHRMLCNHSVKVFECKPCLVQAVGRSRVKISIVNCERVTNTKIKMNESSLLGGEGRYGGLPRGANCGIRDNGSNWRDILHIKHV